MVPADKITTMCWIKADSGKSLQLSQAGQVDIVMVHAPAAEKKANEMNGYFMTDSSTWVAGKKGLKNIKVLFKGDPVLINTYHGLCRPEGATPAQPHASKFIDFLNSDQGQQIIGNYGKSLYGEAMYNDAVYAKQYDH